MPSCLFYNDWLSPIVGVGPLEPTSVPLNRLLLLPNHKLQQVEKDASQAVELPLPYSMPKGSMPQTLYLSPNRYDGRLLPCQSP
jgi:hypothetical protein